MLATKRSTRAKTVVPQSARLQQQQQQQQQQASSTRSAPRIIHGKKTVDEFKIDRAYKWWNDHLKVTAKRKCGWLEFRPAVKYIENSGFIPLQYVQDLIEDTEYDSVSSLSAASKKRITNRVLANGTRGVHYAMGWLELYDLVHRFGQTRPDDHNLRPGDPHHEIIISYNGPPLLTTNPGDDSGPPKQILSPSRRTNRWGPPVHNSADSSTVDPAKGKGKGKRKRPQETEEERLAREDEEFCRAQEERCNRMVMIGFWESRRKSFPWLYDEKFPNGIENANF
jgi:hypothetical protein